VVALDGERVMIHPLAVHDLIKTRSEGIQPQDSYDERRTRVRERLRRPFDELGKIE
jgi:hypothetical protein